MRQTAADILAGAVVLAVLSTTAGRAQTADPDLYFGVTGSADAFPQNRNPGWILGHEPVQRLMLDLTAGERSDVEIDRALEGTGVSRADLEAIAMIRRSGARYALNFTMLPGGDVTRIAAAAERYGASLTAAYVGVWPEFLALLKQYPVPSVDTRALAFALIGCFSLDWDGLDLTDARGYRTAAHPRLNGTYNIWAEERSNLQGLYWGSSNEYLDRMVFTSFGDHYAVPRMTFPDLVWRMNGAARGVDMPQPTRAPLARLEAFAMNVMLDRAGLLLVSVRNGTHTRVALAETIGSADTAASLVDALTGLGYLSRSGDSYDLAVPVLTRDDTAMVQAVRTRSGQVMEAWLKTQYAPLRNELRDLAPVRAGVPYEQVFTRIWHHVFGVANRQLVERGLFVDPYAPSRPFKGFIPFVWDRSLSDAKPF